MTSPPSDLLLWITAIAAFLGGAATGALAWRKFRRDALKRAKRPRPPNLFFSMQMADLSDEKYQAVRKDILEIVDYANALKRLGKIYFFNQKLPSHDALDTQHFPIAKYMRELNDCDYFIAIVSKRIHSSIYFEAGYALAEGKECILFTAAEDVLPTIAKHCCDTYLNCKAVPFTDFDDVIHQLRQMIPQFQRGRDSS